MYKAQFSSVNVDTSIQIDESMPSAMFERLPSPRFLERSLVYRACLVQQEKLLSKAELQRRSLAQQTFVEESLRIIPELVSDLNPSSVPSSHCIRSLETHQDLTDIISPHNLHGRNPVLAGSRRRVPDEPQYDLPSISTIAYQFFV